MKSADNLFDKHRYPSDVVDQDRKPKRVQPPHLPILQGNFSHLFFVLKKIAQAARSYFDLRRVTDVFK